MELSREIDEKEQEEESIIFDNSFDEVINTSVRDPPDDKKITCDRRVQAFIPQKVTPEIRECRKLKLLCFAAVCEILYGHQCLLNSPPLATIPEEPEIGEPFNKKRRAADDYIRYKNALPDVKPINE